MNTGAFALFAAAFVLAFFSAAVSAAETAIFSLNNTARNALRRSHPAVGRRIERLLDDPRRTLNALLLADSLFNLPLIFIALLYVRERPFGERAPDWMAAAGLFAAIIFFCELLPKLVAVARPQLVARLGAGIAANCLRWLEGPVDAIEQLGRLWMARRGGAVKAASGPGAGEYLTLIELAQQDGALLEVEARMIRELVKLGGEGANHCMTPRVDTFGIPDDLTLEEAVMLIRGRRYHRVLVYGGTPDEVLGVLDVEKFLLHRRDHYIECLEPPAFVPETMEALELLRSFIRHSKHMAILVDEFGGIEGIVTISDLIEELIGEEGLSGQSELYIEEIGPGRLLASGNARLDDLGERLGLDLEHEVIDTLGGLLIERAGELPRPGALVRLPGWRATVRRATRKRIKEVLLEREGPPPALEDAP